jgi:hypothetical protein
MTETRPCGGDAFQPVLDDPFNHMAPRCYMCTKSDLRGGKCMGNRKPYGGQRWATGYLHAKAAGVVLKGGRG